MILEQEFLLFNCITVKIGRLKYAFQSIAHYVLRKTDDTTLNSITNLNLSAEPQMGLIAQEVEAVAPELVKSFINPGSTDSTGVVKDNYSVKSINYDGVIPVLVEAIKDLKAQVDSLIANSTSQRLMNDNNTPENQSTKSETINQQKIVLSNHQGIILNQNDPNPFTESTRITFQMK